MKKIVDGKEIEMSTHEEAAFLAQQEIDSAPNQVQPAQSVEERLTIIEKHLGIEISK
jgi:hypothetical protein